MSLRRPVLHRLVSYTFRAGICPVVCRVRSLSYSPCLESARLFGGWGVSLTRAAICLIVCRVRSLSYSPCLESVLSFGGWGVSLTRPVLESDRRFRSLSYTSYSRICLVVVSVTLPMLKSVFSFGE